MEWKQDRWPALCKWGALGQVKLGRGVHVEILLFQNLVPVSITVANETDQPNEIQRYKDKNILGV